MPQQQQQQYQRYAPYTRPTNNPPTSESPHTPARTTGAPGTVQALKTWEWWTRRMLRPYPVYDGNVFFNQANVDEKTYLAPRNFATLLNCDNSELCHRMGIGMSILCGTQVTVARYFEEFSSALTTGRTGIQEWAAILESEEGAQFLEACRAMNISPYAAAGKGKNQTDITEQDLSAHTKTFLKFMLNDNYQRAKILGKIIRFCGRLYLSATHLLEAFSLATNLDDWGEKYAPKVDNHPWFRNPSDVKLLRKFICDSLLQTLERRSRPPAGHDLLQSSGDELAAPTKKKEPRKKTTRPATARDLDTSGSDPRGSDSDSSALPRKKKKKKTTKTAIRHPSSDHAKNRPKSLNSTIKRNTHKKNRAPTQRPRKGQRAVWAATMPQPHPLRETQASRNHKKNPQGTSGTQAPNLEQ